MLTPTDALLTVLIMWMIAIIMLCMIIAYGPHRVRPCACGRRLHHECREQDEPGCGRCPTCAPDEDVS